MVESDERLEEGVGGPQICGGMAGGKDRPVVIRAV